jgi:fructose-specific phosphotransferase system component IIB
VKHSRASHKNTNLKIPHTFMAKLKLSREQIEQGLEQIPMSTLLRGATGSEVNLTHKQIAFAKELALGKSTQADAYRKVYKSKGRPKTVGSNASKLSTDQRIATAVEAFKAAEAYREYQTPTQLRSLVVSQLTKHVLDEDFPPAQRVACLKLLGSVAEVGLFLDRKETLVVHKSDDIRQRLMDQLKTVMNTQAEDITVNDDADSLLAELSETPPENQNQPDDDPTVPAPPDLGVEYPMDYIHSIPHESTSQKSDPHESPNQKSNEEAPHVYPDKSNTL